MGGEFHPTSDDIADGRQSRGLLAGVLAALD
jgi:hypothetical protein